MSRKEENKPGISHTVLRGLSLFLPKTERCLRRVLHILSQRRRAVCASFPPDSPKDGEQSAPHIPSFPTKDGEQSAPHIPISPKDGEQSAPRYASLSPKDGEQSAPHCPYFSQRRRAVCAEVYPGYTRRGVHIGKVYPGIPGGVYT